MAGLLSIAGVVKANSEPRRQSGRGRGFGAGVAIFPPGSAAAHEPLAVLPPVSPREGNASDALLARVEEALAEEIERAQALGTPNGGVGSLRSRLLDVRAAREQARLAAALAGHQAGLRPVAASPGAGRGAACCAPTPEVGAGEAESRKSATMRGALLRRLTQPLRIVSPGALGLLVNVLA